MSKLKIKNFGPIKDGLTEGDGFIDFSKITLFIGDQSTGKSTIVKLFATFKWLEKSLESGRYRFDEIASEFIEKQLKYYRIDNYLCKLSVLEYKGDKYNFLYKDEKLILKGYKNKYTYWSPKIVYIPAERNFITSIQSADKAINMPRSLDEFHEDYLAATTSNNNIPLPISNLTLLIDNKLETPRITDKNNTYEISILETSSGVQSLVPLYAILYNESLKIIKNHGNLSNKISFEEIVRFHTKESVSEKSFIKRQFDNEIRQLSYKKEAITEKLLNEYSTHQRLMSEINRIVHLAKNTLIHNDELMVNSKDELIARINESISVISKDQQELKKINHEIYKISKKHIRLILNYNLVSIIEEPEQNLFPNSQKSVLFELIKIINTTGGNKQVQQKNQLVITTHSPYLLGYLTLSIKSSQLADRLKGNKELLNKLFDVVPKHSTIDATDVIMYHVKENGKIVNIEHYDSLLNDDNILNNSIGDISKIYSMLLDIEDEFEATE